MLRTCCLCAMFLPLGVASAAAPTAPIEPAVVPASAAAVKSSCDAQLAAAAAARAKFEAMPLTAGWSALLRAYDDTYETLSYSRYDAYVVQATSPDADKRAAAEDCIQRATREQTAFGMSRAAYERLQAVDQAEIPQALRHMVSRQLLSFRLNGVDKDEATRQGIARSWDEITALSNEFGRNLNNDARTIVAMPGQLAGMPEDFIRDHPAGPDGKVHLPVDETTWYPATVYAKDRRLREDFDREFFSRAYPANDAVLRRMFVAAANLARQIGYPTYADFELSYQMAGTPQRARAFLDDIAAQARPAGQREVARMLARLRKDEPTAATLLNSDAWYARSLIRKEEYQADPAVARRYLRYDKVRDGIFRLVGDLFGVTIRPWRTAVWAPRVQAFEMLEGGRVIGRFYLDSHPREGKFTHGQMAPIRIGVRGRRVPVAALVMNLPEGHMELGDTETFLHEFGHLVHWLFAGRNAYAAQNPFELENDALEAPSQMLEEWIHDYDTLERFATDDEGAVIRRELVDGLNASRRFGQAFAQLHDLGYAAISLDCYSKDLGGRDLTEAVNESRMTYAVAPFPPNTHMQASFQHITPSAAYYRYAWSKALAWDFLGRFRAEGLRNRATAKAYREAILAPGGSESMNVLARRFLGREWSADAWRKELAAGAAEGVGPPAR